ncbi:cysteine rich repeat-containing protein [Rhizobium calliandrae]|uniref:Cysteine rich repeat-containing protein n=1 Tax=Rhizobium calliandrae TaxID=1312182 RepID=A0ABT7KNM6_9HYPH|nr:cysteine rich repeat-containing protein [Rhizobium calliandrae]MDL2410249.1 cysteine rich repeat-containing protein [Rhizobium calliandrae]
MGQSASFLATVPHGRQYLLTAYTVLCTLLGVFCLFVGVAHSQQPSAAQRNAIKSACRSDFIAQCSGVSPGGIEALTCLQKHSATLSPACRSAVSAVGAPKQKSSAVAPAETPGTAPAQSSAAGATQAHQPTQAQRDAVKSACRSDFMAQCSDVTPGGAEALTCLRQHNSTLSPSCQQAVAALGGSASAPAAGGGAAATSAPAAHTAMPSFTPRQELMIMRQSCGPDFRAFCRSVPLGGGRGIACLRDNLQRVSPSCHRVLTSGL